MYIYLGDDGVLHRWPPEGVKVIVTSVDARGKATSYEATRWPPAQAEKEAPKPGHEPEHKKGEPGHEKPEKHEPDEKEVPERSRHLYKVYVD